jgi:hypothetical protein
MRSIKLIIACMAVSCQLLAQNTTKDINKEHLLNLKPNITTRSEVEKVLGAAPQQQIDKHLARWKYASDNYQVSMDWENDILRRSTFHSHNKSIQWNRDNRNVLEIGTELGKVMETLGLPTDMEIQTAGHFMRYVYQDNLLSLTFKDGQLSKYEMSGPVSKR